MICGATSLCTHCIGQDKMSVCYKLQLHGLLSLQLPLLSALCKFTVDPFIHFHTLPFKSSCFFLVNLHCLLSLFLKFSPCQFAASPVVTPLGDHLCENGFEYVEILPSTNEAHGGVIVDLKEAMDPEVFAALLKSSLLQWKKQGKDGVWIKLPIELANLVETAVKGFWYHHAEPNYVMLVYWIPKTGCTIPTNASHCVSIAAIVLNDKKEMLVVQEKRGRFHGIGVWKLPTGVVDAGEDIFAAAIREVKEETGVDTEFVQVLGFRQAHNSFFGKSDIDFLCMLRPLSFDIKKQELEIEAAQWKPFEEYAVQPFNQKHEPFKYIIQLCLAKMERVYTGFCPWPVSSFFSKDLNYIYLNSQDLDKSS